MSADIVLAVVFGAALGGFAGHLHTWRHARKLRHHGVELKDWDRHFDMQAEVVGTPADEVRDALTKHIIPRIGRAVTVLVLVLVGLASSACVGESVHNGATVPDDSRSLTLTESTKGDRFFCAEYDEASGVARRCVTVDALRKMISAPYGESVTVVRCGNVGTLYQDTISNDKAVGK